ncbi:hypothetical protein QD46_21285 [Paenibacillus polymyxa]|nr:hypothetical protein QD46_21285 [Paenibacillus polymyxa]
MPLRIYFNPRTHKECDLVAAGYLLGGRVISIHALTWSATKLLDEVNGHEPPFQSTHSRGVRQRKNSNSYPNDINSSHYRKNGCQKGLDQSLIFTEGN